MWVVIPILPSYRPVEHRRHRFVSKLFGSTNLLVTFGPIKFDPLLGNLIFSVDKSVSFSNNKKLTKQ